MLELIDYKTVAFFVAWGVILVRGSMTGAYRLYAPFYIYVAAVVGSVIAGYAAAAYLGTDSRGYVRVYIVVQVTIHVARGAFLVWLLSMPRRFQSLDVLYLILIAVLSAFLEYLLSSQSALVWRLSRASIFFLFLLSFLVILRFLSTEEFRSGLNLGIALGGAFLLLFVEVLNESLYLTGLWDNEDADALSDLASLVCWGATAWGMWDLDPPKRIE